jgi:hypothetical protein
MTEAGDAPPWTDANTSDPGITMLEVLVYGIAALVAVAIGATWWRVARRACENRVAR